MATLLNSTTIQITGTLTAVANTTYRIESFASSSNTPPGQGRTLRLPHRDHRRERCCSISALAPSLPANAGTSITATATDPTNNTSAFSTPVNAKHAAVFAVGADAGGLPQVNVYNADGSLRYTFLAFDAGFRGGVRVAVGNVAGQQVIVVAAGAGAPGRTSASSAQTGQQLPGPLGSFFAYDAGFTGGVFVAVGDVNGDGFDDIVTSAGAGAGPHVKVFSGQDGSVLQSFLAYDAGFTGGVSVATGFVNGDIYADIITGAGPGAGPNVKVFDGSNPNNVLSSFYAFDPSFSGGVYVAGGNVRGGLTDLVIVGAGAGGLPQVNIYNGSGGEPTRQLLGL